MVERHPTYWIRKENPMPMYDFSCTECGAKFEKNIPFQANPADIACPKGHHAARRIFSAPQVVFKGNGWYSTDHRNGSSVSAGTAE
jgi:putative FmdB family regulatory protein